MNWKYIFNPFLKYSEKALFLLGISGFVLMNIVCILIKNRMNGILHWEEVGNESLQNIILINGGIMLSTIVIFFVFGKIINKNTRFIDVANAFLLSTIPSTLVLLWGQIPMIHSAQKNIIKAGQNPDAILSHSADLLLVCLGAMVALPLIIYIVILMFNGFKTATNMKKTWQIIVFFVLLFVLNSITQSYF